MVFKELLNVICPICQENISHTDSTSDSKVRGYLDRSYECKNCDITIYTYKMELGTSK